jgi:spoIIIJ-associated protein
MVPEQDASIAFAEQVQEEQRMNHERPKHGKKPDSRGLTRDVPPLDRARAVAELETFLGLAVREMGLEIAYEISPSAAKSPGEEPQIMITFRGADEGLLLEGNAELLLALEHIAHRWLRLDPRLHDSVRFDCGDFRATRLDELKLSARVAAQRVRETGQPFPFNPMPPRERRIIHLELTGAAGVRTVSEGTGDRRHLVIYPANKKP